MDTKMTTTDFAEMLNLQLTEVQMLESMFSNPGEFIIDSHDALAELQAFVDGETAYESLDSRVGFTIRIKVSSAPVNEVELVCHLPHEYPNILPEVFLRTPSMDRESSRRLSEDFHDFLAAQETGQILIGMLIEWLQQNAHIYVKKQLLVTNSSKQGTDKEEKTFTRLWIYSHHIYSKFKRRDIIDWASELSLHGFSMPGKPGIICVEGGTRQIDEFWFRIRRLNWKRLVIKEQEVVELDGKKINSLCKFEKFEELNFEIQGGKGKRQHMDLGKFYEFLQERDCAYIFPLCFGVEGKGVGNAV